MIPSLSVPRHSASMVCFKGALYVVGGLRDNKRARELSVEVFHSEENEWKKKSSIPVTCEHVGDGWKKPVYKACFANLHRCVLWEINTLEHRRQMEELEAEMQALLTSK